MDAVKVRQETRQAIAVPDRAPNTALRCVDQNLTGRCEFAHAAELTSGLGWVGASLDQANGRPGWGQALLQNSFVVPASAGIRPPSA